VILLLVGLLVMLGMGLLGGAVGAAGDAQGVPGVGGFLAGLGVVLGVILLAIGALYLAIAYGVWKARSWSWMLGVVVSIIAIIFGVLGLSGGVNAGSLISLALPIIVVYFLWQPDVKRYLGRPACPRPIVDRAGRCPPAGSSIRPFYG
jgi:hypothetical protein